MTQGDNQSPRYTIEESARRYGLLRPRDVEALGVHRQHVQRMYENGQLVRLGRGLYALPGDSAAGAQTLAQVTARVPKAVVCLISALAFHDMTTHVSDRVWIAVGHRARQPSIIYPPIEVVRMSGATLTYGVERHDIGGVGVNVFTPAKTVADCFKYRNRVGLDVAIEALRDAWQRRKCTADELWEAAQVCRVSRVMRPYIEAIV